MSHLRLRYYLLMKNGSSSLRAAKSVLDCYALYVCLQNMMMYIAQTRESIHMSMGGRAHGQCTVCSSMGQWVFVTHRASYGEAARTHP